MEFTYTPNYDGITLIEDPRVLLSRGEIKPDMDFVIFEVTSNEAETMTRNIFGSESMQQILFPNDYSSLFNVNRGLDLIKTKQLMFRIQTHTLLCHKRHGKHWFHLFSQVELMPRS